MKQELQALKNDKFNNWFEENYKAEEWYEKVKNSAAKGYSALSIPLTEGIDDEEWLMLNNPCFLQKMQELFSDLNVYIKKYEKKEFRITITGTYWENIEHKRLVIDWSGEE